MPILATPERLRLRRQTSKSPFSELSVPRWIEGYASAGLPPRKHRPLKQYRAFFQVRDGNGREPSKAGEIQPPERLLYSRNVIFFGSELGNGGFFIISHQSRVRGAPGKLIPGHNFPNKPRKLIEGSATPV